MFGDDGGYLQVRMTQNYLLGGFFGRRYSDIDKKMQPWNPLSGWTANENFHVKKRLGVI